MLLLVMVIVIMLGGHWRTHPLRLDRTLSAETHRDRGYHAATTTSIHATYIVGTTDPHHYVDSTRTKGRSQDCGDEYVWMHFGHARVD